MITFPYYSGNILYSHPIGMVSLDDFYNAIRNPKPHILKTLALIQEASKRGDEDKRAALKQTLYSFTPCVHVSGSRAYENITAFTGLLVLDFDKLALGIAPEFKNYIFQEYDFIAACWMSPSRLGIKALVRIPVVDCLEDFKSYHLGLEKLIMNKYHGYDPTTKNCVLPLFLSHDPNILIREDPELWEECYTPPPKRKTPEIYKITPDIERVTVTITNLINKIHDQGHPQLRAASYLLGGYVAAGYIDHDSAEELILSLVSKNAYLSNPKKINGYKKTALTMLESGTQLPLYF